jgi:hypothetical protein
MRGACLAHLTLLDFIILTMAKSTSQEAPHYAGLSYLLLVHPSLLQMLSVAPNSQIPSVHVVLYNCSFNMMAAS